MSCARNEREPVRKARGQHQTISEGHMSECKSAYSIIQKVYQGYGDYVKAIPGVVAGAITANPAAVFAAIKAAGKLEEVINHAHDYWNENIGKNGPGTIGPRVMELGNSYSGTVVWPGQRTFVASMPSPYETVRVRITEKEGTGKTDIKICLVDAEEHHREVAHKTLNETGTEKKDTSQVMNETIGDALGKVVVVLFTGQTPLNKFAYTLAFEKA
jgi:hypothetical protein